MASRSGSAEFSRAANWPSTGHLPNIRPVQLRISGALLTLVNKINLIVKPATPAEV
jgi:hypothetical protein